MEKNQSTLVLSGEKTTKGISTWESTTICTGEVTTRCIGESTTETIGVTEGYPMGESITRTIGETTTESIAISGDLPRSGCYTSTETPKFTRARTESVVHKVPQA